MKDKGVSVLVLVLLFCSFAACSGDDPDPEDTNDNVLVARVSGSASVTFVGESVTFSGRGSNGTGLTYEWNYDDGSAFGQGLETTHSFSKPGKYSVTLTVGNDRGDEDTAVFVVHVHDRYPYTDTLTPLGSMKTYDVVINPTSQGFKTNLTYPSGTVNTVVLNILLPNGTVHESSAGAERDPGDTQSVEFEISWRFLADENFQDWTVQIQLTAGLSVDCRVYIEVYY